MNPGKSIIIEKPESFMDAVKCLATNFRLIGLDVGEKKIGVSLVNSQVPIPVPYVVINRKGIKQDVTAICTLIINNSVAGIVIGLPIQMDGQEGRQAKEVRAFADRLGRQAGIPLIFEDERFTTRLANTMLSQANLTRKQRTKLDDQVSAQLILESFLRRLL